MKDFEWVYKLLPVFEKIFNDRSTDLGIEIDDV